jgi:pimeloyl-ACP methyl ester carboxylesterase
MLRRAPFLLAILTLSGCAAVPTASERASSLAVQGGAIGYGVAGFGPPLILLHGGGLDRRMWDPLMPRLTPAHLTIRWDARGHGATTAPASPAASGAEDLRLLLDRLGIRRGTVAGFSMGGGTATEFALAYPDRVERLILISTSGPPPGVPIPAAAPPPLTTPEGRRRLAASGVRVVMIVGAQDSERVRTTGEAVAAEVPGARLIVIPDGGHNIVADRPDAVAAALLAASRNR